MCIGWRAVCILGSRAPRHSPPKSASSTVLPIISRMVIRSSSGVGRPTKYQPLKIPVNHEVGQKREGKGDGEGTVTFICRLADAELVCEDELCVTQEGELSPQPGLEGRLDLGRINRDSRQPAIRDFSTLMELNQFPQLHLSLGSPRSPVESQDQRLPACQLSDRHLLLSVIG